MPSRPKTPCNAPGCPALCDSGQRYCDKHKELDPRNQRNSYGLYNARWRKLRKLVLESKPLCAECLRRDRHTEATVVDHIIPHRGNVKLMYDIDNLQPLCKRCHDRKTAKEESFGRYTYEF